MDSKKAQQFTDKIMEMVRDAASNAYREGRKGRSQNVLEDIVYPYESEIHDLLVEEATEDES